MNDIHGKVIFVFYNFNKKIIFSIFQIFEILESINFRFSLLMKMNTHFKKNLIKIFTYIPVFIESSDEFQQSIHSQHNFMYY